MTALKSSSMAKRWPTTPVHPDALAPQLPLIALGILKEWLFYSKGTRKLPPASRYIYTANTTGGLTDCALFLY
jgi:hypothetical protein